MTGFRFSEMAGFRGACAAETRPRASERGGMTACARESGWRESTSINLIIQVSPRRITPLNQFDLPCSIPFLDRPFSLDGTFHGFMNLVPNQPMNTVTFRESFHQVILVLPNPLGEIRSDTDIQSATGFARKNVNAWNFHRNLWTSATRFRGYKLRGNDGNLLPRSLPP